MSRWRRPDKEQLAAFEAFVRQHARALAALSRGLSPSSASAQDLLQETLVKVLERWEQVDGARDPYLYARRMMVNSATSSWRRGWREQHHRSAEQELTRGAGAEALLWGPAGGAADGMKGSEARHELLAALRRLPERQRMVIVLRYLEQMPDAEICDLMNISAGTVRSSALRGLKALKRFFTDLEPTRP